MSFIQKILSIFSSNKITITTVPYMNMQNNNSNNTLKYTFNSITVQQLLNNLNKYRHPSRQVKACYMNGFKLSGSFKITEFYYTNRILNFYLQFRT